MAGASLTAAAITQAWRGAEPNAAYPADTTAILLKLQCRYADSNRPISVSFRGLVPWIKVGERATHYLHPYPAKLLPQIAHFFLAADGWLGADELVLDPFAGAGTVALEACLSGRNTFFADVNPLSHLITTAKVSPIDVFETEKILDSIKSRFGRCRNGEVPWVVNIDHWYTKKAVRNLARLRRAINETDCGDSEYLVWATFSVAARKCSSANPRFAVPVRQKEMDVSDCDEKSVWDTFADQFRANLQRHRKLAGLSSKFGRASWVGNDARSLLNPFLCKSTDAAKLPGESIGLILTSPPYAGAQKYIRASSLSLGWLGMTEERTLKVLENQSIGREHFRKELLNEIPPTGVESADKLITRINAINPTRAAICAHYLIEMDEAIAEMARVLKPNGNAVIVIGDNTVCGIPFPSSRFLTELFERKGLKLALKLVDKIRSRGLLMKRSGGAAAIASETILVFKK